MKNLLKTFKILFINTLILSLMQNSFIDSALAADKKSNSGWGASDIMGIANTTLGVYSNYLGQKQMMMQQQIMSSVNQQMMAQLSPSCRKPDGSACFVTQGKYFPECSLPASMSNMPKNVCSGATTNPNQVSSMITHEAIANGWINYYDQMANKASNATYPTGLRCLEDKQKALDSQLTEMVNNLQRLQDRLNQDKQIFRDNNKKLLEEMNLAKEELFGGSKDLNSKTRDFAKFFSQSCQTIIGKERIASGKDENMGLNGILEGLSNNNKAAADFTSNRAIIENDIRREADKISSSISSRGVGDWLEGLKTSPELAAPGMPGLAQAAGKQINEFDTAIKRITKTLDDVGYKAPAMDKNFTTDLDEFMASSNDFFKKKFVHDCVTGAEKGVAIPVEDILKSLEQKRTKSGGTVTMDYRVALRKVLESDAMMDKKMAMIKDLEAQYPGITITYKAANQTTVSESPYTLFMKTIEKCEERYVQDDQFSTKGGSKGVSFQKKVDRARAALAELKNLNDTFASRINQAITSQMLSCNGEEPKSGAACSEETMKPSSPGFCVAHASKCSNDIQGCYAEANNHVQVRKTKMENLSKRFNANVAAMIANTNAMYEQQKMAVTNITKMIQSRFPGVNFEIPKDMFVPMPEMKKDAYGVEMAENGNLAAILDGEGSMPVKIEKLKDMFKKQREKVNSEITNYIALQEGAMQKNRGEWEKLASECKAAVNQSSENIAKANQEGMKRQGEIETLVQKYCDKYSDLRTNPTPSCDEAEGLMSDWEKIIEKGGQNRISSSSVSVSKKFNSVCKALNNESAGSDRPSYCDKAANDKSADQIKICNDYDKKQAAKLGNGGAGKVPSLAELCDNEKATDDETFIDNVFKNLPASDKEEFLKTETNKAALIKALNTEEKIPSLDALAGKGFFHNLNSGLNGVEGKTICEKIHSKQINVKKEAKESEARKLAAEITDLENKIKNAEAKQKDDLQKQLTDKTAAKANLEAEKGNLSKVNMADLNLTFGSTNLLEMLAKANSDASATSEVGLQTTLSSLGQQADESCDSLNSSGMAKGFDMQNYLRNYDQGKLGINR